METEIFVKKPDVGGSRAGSPRFVGIGGFVNTSVTTGGDYTAQMLVHPDGKILVGETSQPGNPTEYYVSMGRCLGASAAASRPLFDYDGDGKSEIAVYRPSTGVWYLQRSTDGFAAMQFGVSTDIPTPNAFVP